MKKILLTSCFIIFFNSSLLFAENLEIPWGSVLEDNPNVVKIACEYDETATFKRQDEIIASEINRSIVDYFYIRKDSIFSLRPRIGDYYLETYKEDGTWKIRSPDGAKNQVSDATVNDNLIKLYHSYEGFPNAMGFLSTIRTVIIIDRNTGQYNIRQYIGTEIMGEPGSTEIGGNGTCNLSESKKKF